MTKHSLDKFAASSIMQKIREIENFVHGASETDFISNLMMQRAVMMTLVNIGELTKKFSPEFLAANNEIPWPKVVGLRNIAVHEYDALNMTFIWLVVKENLPELKTTLHKALIKNNDEHSR